MELRQLEYFIAIAETGAFSRAALRLSVAQPVLSRQIKALEEELGTELCYRTGRGIVLTEAGRILEQHARGVLETTAGARRAIHALGSAPAGRVVIGMPPSVGAVLTAPIVRQFRAQFPRVWLGVMEGFSGHVLEWLMTGRIDVAVLYNAPRTGSLLSDPLLTDELFLLGPVADPAGAGAGEVRAARLAELPMILPSRPHGLRVLVDDFLSKIGVTPNVQVEIDAMPSTLSLVEDGIGYTILSYSCVHHLIEAGRIRKWSIVEPAMSRTLVVATSTQRPVTKAARALVGFVRKQVDALVADGRWSPKR
ncbi:MAG TPA: LysR substrate-binding domain-containing protein [Burkholderiales bacterium]|jgi:LysR family nitrogen assimilation transcriptional regulator|nr:LysR substrate-binding domain-containing protein [Burkholderiales bacterium]